MSEVRRISISCPGCNTKLKVKPYEDEPSVGEFECGICGLQGTVDLEDRQLKRDSEFAKEM